MSERCYAAVFIIDFEIIKHVAYYYFGLVSANYKINNNLRCFQGAQMGTLSRNGLKTK